MGENMNLQPIIAALADEADELLSDAANQKEARQVLSETLEARYPKLSQSDRQKVVGAVLEILEEEGFFDEGRGGDSWSEGGEEAEEE